MREEFLQVARARILDIEAILADDQLPSAVAVRQRRAPGQIVHLAGQIGGEVARFGTEDFGAALEHGRLLGAETRHARALLRTDLAVRAADLPACLGACRALARAVAFEDHGAVEDVFA